MTAYPARATAAPPAAPANMRRHHNAPNHVYHQHHAHYAVIPAKAGIHRLGRYVVQS
jgi:hypothetical protein